MIFDILVTIGMVFLWALWIMLPAYIPNPVAALVGGGTPIDFGKTAKDGRRIFGDGKTWRGLIGGIIGGIIFGGILMLLRWFFNLNFLPEHTWITIIFLSIGSLLGDLIKSYFKRRLGKDRGTKWPLADMYDMVIGSLVLMTIAQLLSGHNDWFISVLTSFTAGPVINFGLPWIGITIFIAIIIISPLAHRCANIIGYIFKLKDVPW